MVTLYRTRANGILFNAPLFRTYEKNEMARTAINNFSFLLPFNQSVSGQEFAKMIRDYSVSIQATACANAFENQ